MNPILHAGEVVDIQSIQSLEVREVDAIACHTLYELPLLFVRRRARQFSNLGRTESTVDGDATNPICHH